MEFLNIGKIVSTHGIKGEVKVYPYTDNIENLARRKYFYLDDKKVNVTKCSIFKDMLIMKLENISSPEEAKVYVGKNLYIEKQKIDKENTYYVEDLIGVDVYKRYSIDEEYSLLGTINYVYTGSANDVYEVKAEGKTIYLPAIKDVVEKVDIQNKKMYVKMMEGLE